MSQFGRYFTGQPASASEPTAVPTEPYRLLLVDDEPGVLKALTRVFRQEAYEVVTAANATEGLARLREHTVHLVISDYLMPGINGAEFLRQVKALSPDTLRIMLTGHADTGAVMGAINEGAVYKFILKPWNDDDLRVTVALALEQFDLVQRNRALAHENTRKSKEIAALARITGGHASRLGIALHKKNLLSDAQLQELHRLHQARREPLVTLLLEKGWLDERRIRAFLKRDLLIDEVALAEIALAPALAELLPRSLCERQLVVPVALDGRRLTLAMADPMDTALSDEIRFTAGLELQIVMADVAAIRERIAALYGDAPDIRALETLAASGDPYEGIEIVIDEDDLVPLDVLLADSDAPPAIRLANAVVLEAIRLGASDIHLQPRAKAVIVRYRIDGVLQDKIQIPHHLHGSLVSRFKIMAELDIAERRRPQDGRLTVKTPLKIVDLRISTLPTINGEKIVMRLLDRNAAVPSLGELGFRAADLGHLRACIDRPQGIILATGPTGSGKTTTLYALLQANADAGKNYVTIEDPVEYYLDSAGQVLIKEKIGLTFPSVLRAILRQDPDVILIGEIRDFDTAEVAFHAALTGHQVFSTLHTNSAVATIARLLDLGLKPYVIASALEAVLAQRLVRAICPACREEVAPDRELLARLGGAFIETPPRTYIGRGCNLCHGTGYKGRIGLFELFVMTDALREAIGQGGSLLELDTLARQAGMCSLAGDAYQKVGSGNTSAAEALRVLGPVTKERR
jgi:type II secretory ATPase GspE/PulE/Tfp pilus assembly ATPase PilB-like protein/DNA-binding NarL/FixJ family response regulator